MRPDSKIYVAGHRGLVGSAVERELLRRGYENLLTRTRRQLDLSDPPAVDDYFASERPEYVFLAAAKVGGIHANDAYRADFIVENLLLQTNVLVAAHRYSVRKLLFLGSSCIYPKFAPQPIREDALLTGPLEETNRAYAIAKIAGIETCDAFNRQYGCDFLPVMPANLYGPGDNYDLVTSHALPAILRKVHEAKIADSETVTIWGTGTVRREFMYSEDLANACVFLMERYGAKDIGGLINIGTGSDLTIRELTALIADVVGFEGRICHDLSQPDGTPRKLLDVSRLNALGWQATTQLRNGLELTYKAFLDSEGKSGGTEIPAVRRS
jgi:GDP-L-fucose synthase